jgi:hypothetical protein
MKDDDRSNYVSEWFGHRVFPTVATDSVALDDQRTRRCPFLSRVLLGDRECIKAAASKGICTISASSNGPRQDWLVCPYRALDDDLLSHAARTLFRLRPDRQILILSAPNLSSAPIRENLKAFIAAGGAGFVYLQDKLGGEISLGRTDRSPEMSFDATIIEVTPRGGEFEIGRYGILELQTMDFHGSYRKVVNNLQDALRLHSRSFHEELARKPEWLSEDIEGPNISNVFKRTFYQVMVKFQLSGHGSCAGCVLALPESVWDSWQRHLSTPPLKHYRNGYYSLRTSEGPGSARSNWIYVFDLERSAAITPDRIALRKVIATDADALAHYALKVAPEAALAEGGSADRLLSTIWRRLARWWPDLVGPPDGPRRPARSQKTTRR